MSASFKEIFAQGSARYLNTPRPPQATFLNDQIYNLCAGLTVVRANNVIWIVSDPKEDLDDTTLFLILTQLFAATGLKINYILSGGLVNPLDRLNFLTTIEPEVREFGVEYRGFLTIYPDGHLATEPFDGLLMAGPCCKSTFQSLCHFVTSTVITIGTLESGLVDPAAPLPINCKVTDVEGLLTPDSTHWNAHIDFLRAKAVTVIALTPDIGRMTAAPTGPLVAWLVTHPVYLSQQNQARLLNLTSRPPAFLGNRLHVANATVVGQWPEPVFDESRFNHGVETVQAYLATAKPEMVDSLTESVTYVVINAALRGAIYLPGKFGSPSKTFTDFLTQGSIDELTATLVGGVPLYDVGGFVMLLNSLCVM